MSGSGSWYADLVRTIERRIDTAIALYPKGDAAVVVFNVIRALHARADAVDGTATWIHIALVAADVPPTAARAAATTAPVASSHPSTGDAEDIAEDLAALELPGRNDSPAVALRAAVHVAWTRFAHHVDPTRRALLAAEAARLA